MAVKLPIFASRNFNFGRNLKQHFPKGIFHFIKEIWLIIGDYEYIYITKINKKYIYIFLLMSDFRGENKILAPH